MNTPLNLLLGGAALVGALAALTSPAAAATVHLDHLAARVIVIPEARATITAEVTSKTGGEFGRPTLTTSGADLTVSGGLTNARLHDCHVTGHGRGIGLGLFHKVNIEDLPVVTIRTPMDVTIVADGAMIGEIGPSNALSLSEKHCGAWHVGAVAGHLDASIEGITDLYAGSTGSTNLRLDGMGDIHIASAGAFDGRMEGMGDVVVDQVNGPVHVELDGMGDLHIKGGHATSFNASLNGMGDIKFDGVADTVEASADGMGDVTVAKATGAVHTSHDGMATVRVGK
jgi:hypothetical protein